MSSNIFLKNIFFQARRASKELNIPLTCSKDIIAKSIYQCHDFNDLCNKFANNSLKASVYPYCQIHPNSRVDAKRYIEKNIATITNRLSKLIFDQNKKVLIKDLVWKIFGFSYNHSICENIPCVEINNWNAYRPVSNDTNTVMYLDCKINNVPFKVLATQIVTARTFVKSNVKFFIKIRRCIFQFCFRTNYVD